MNVEVSCKSGAQLSLRSCTEVRCQKINTYFIGILRVLVHHIQSASVASLTNLSLELKKKCSI